MSPRGVFLVEGLILKPEGLKDLMRSFVPFATLRVLRMRGRIREKHPTPQLYMNLREKRRQIDQRINPSIWWSIWIAGSVFISYMGIYYGVWLLRENYGLPGYIATQDIALGKLYFFAINMPFMSFTCLLAGHLTLALYKTNKLKRV